MTGDFNTDGKLDIATANAGDNPVSVLLGDVAGGFTASGRPPSESSASLAIRAGIQFWHET